MKHVLKAIRYWYDALEAVTVKHQQGRLHLVLTILWCRDPPMDVMSALLPDVNVKNEHDLQYAAWDC